MRPALHPSLVNGRSGDPALYIETLFERRAILFDLGDISALSARKLLRLEYIFVSHAHIDHFIGFDHLLRLLVSREKTVRLYGPAGLVDHVLHKLHAYRWNLVDRFEADLVFVVTEIEPSLAANTVRYRLKTGFAPETVSEGSTMGNTLCNEQNFRVSTAIVEHGMPCLAFAIEEAAHVNVWKSRLTDMGLAVGPWLRDLKRAVVARKPDDHCVLIDGGRTMHLGELRSAVSVTAGQKLGYVTDVADTVANREAIIRLVRDADLLFIEAPFAAADTRLAFARAHLTTTAAGEIARAAGVRRVEPFHFSSRYAGEHARLLDEVEAAFAGRSTAETSERSPSPCREI